MINNFLIFLRHCDKTPKINYEKELKLDCANGVGALTMSEFLSNPDFSKQLDITLFNNSTDPSLLNMNSGADHVKNGKIPEGWIIKDAFNKIVSFDGDADRIIYFYGTEQSQIVVIDGDKQFGLIMEFITSLMRDL